MLVRCGHGEFRRLYLGTIILNCDLHVSIRILLLAKTLEGRVDLNEETTVAREGGFICTNGWVSSGIM